MNSRKYFYALSAILLLLVGLVIAATAGGNSILEKKSKKLYDLKVQNETIEMQQSALVQAKADAEKYSELNKITRAIVPQDKDQAKTIREIVAIAGQNSIPIKSVSFESSNLGDTAGPSSAATPKTPVSQVKAVEGIPGVYTLEIQVESSGKVSYQSFLKFLDGLEKNRRTAHVTGITLNPANGGRDLDFKLTLSAYVKP